MDYEPNTEEQNDIYQGRCMYINICHTLLCTYTFQYTCSEVHKFIIHSRIFWCLHERNTTFNYIYAYPFMRVLVFTWMYTYKCTLKWCFVYVNIKIYALWYSHQKGCGIQINETPTWGTLMQVYKYGYGRCFVYVNIKIYVF